MAETSYLQLPLTPSNEWSTKKYGDFIKELAGTEATSSLQKIDVAIKELNDKLSIVEQTLLNI